MCETTNDEKTKYVNKTAENILDFLIVDTEQNEKFCVIARQGLNAIAMAVAIKKLLDFLSEETGDMEMKNMTLSTAVAILTLDPNIDTNHLTKH